MEITFELLDQVFNKAEQDTADMFKSQTCSMETKDGEQTCPICYFRGQVKSYLANNRGLTTRSAQLRNEAVASIRDGDSTVTENSTSEIAGSGYGEAWYEYMMKFKKETLVEFLRQAYEKAESKSARHS